MKPLSRLALSALVVALVARPAAAQQSNDRNYRWYWGGQTGAFLYQTNAQGYYIDPVIGAHMLITKKRSALYIGGEQAFFLADGRAVVADPSSTTTRRDATFSQVRRWFAGVLAFPLQKRIEPFVGGGFAIMTVQDATVDCSGTTLNSLCADQAVAQAAVDDARSKGFAWIMGGMQINIGKLAVFGHYMLTSDAQGFLIAGPTHSIQGGIRYSLGTSKEDVNTAH